MCAPLFKANYCLRHGNWKYLYEMPLNWIHVLSTFGSMCSFFAFSFSFYRIRFFLRFVCVCAKPELGWNCRTIDKNSIISFASSGIIKWGALWARLPECTRLFALFQSVYWQIVLSRHHHYYCNIRALFIRLAIPHTHTNTWTGSNSTDTRYYCSPCLPCTTHTRRNEEQRLQAKKLPEN